MSEQQTEQQIPEPQVDYSRGIGQSTPGGRYAEMEPANPLPEETFGEEIKPGREGLEQGAEEIRQRREETKQERQTKTPLPREYQQQGGPKSGERSPVHQSISPEQAAHDLTGARESEVSAEQSALDLELQRQIDALRTGDTAQPEQPQEPYQPQQEQPVGQEQAQPARSKAWEDPEVIAGISEYTSQINEALTQAQQQYVSGLATNAQVALAATVSQFPELRGVNDLSQLAPVINAVAQSNPDRARAMVGHLQQVNQFTEQAQAAQRQQFQEVASQYQQQWNAGAKAHDDAFQKWIDSQEPSPERQREITNTARQILNEAGLSDEQVQQQWNSNPLLRSFAGQQILADAARYRMAHQAARGMVARPVPTVSRPGSPTERGTEADYNLSKYSAELDRTGSAKSAAALLSARRTARR